MKQDLPFFKSGGRKGVTFVFVIIFLLVLLAFFALAVDVGYVMVTRNELQNVADGAALAGARRLGAFYEGMPYWDQQSYDASSDAGTIRASASDVAAQNSAAGQPVSLESSDIKIGTWNSETKVFTETMARPNAVRVVSRRDATANGPVTTFFAKILGINTVDVRATATAALTGQSTAGPGELETPIGISKQWFAGGASFHFCNQPIRFYPANDPSSCGGWNVFNRYASFNDHHLRTTLNDLRTGAYTNPGATAYETQFEFGGGTMSTQTFAAMKNLFDARREGDGDGNPLTWTTTVAVYDSADCSNPNGLMTIVGFATIVITGVQGAPVHQIDGYVVCNNVEFGRGSGGMYGTLGSIPGLVQ